MLVGACDAPDQQQAAERPEPTAAAVATDGPQRPSASPTEGSDSPSSVYTKLAFDACKVTRRATEGEFIEYTCSGLGAVPLYAALGDGRMDLDAGVRNDRFQGLGAFNDIAPTIEWRLAGGEPVAVIFRYVDAGGEAPKPRRTVLAVEKVGRPGAPGCRVAQLGGEVPDVNARARAIADGRAAGFDCQRDPIYEGNAR